MSDIQELFSRDPLSLTRDDISTIVEHYRSQRKAFKEAEASGKKPAPAKRAKAAPVSVDLDDLFKDGL